MKSVIAFVLLGLLTYAGAVFLFSGIYNGMTDAGEPLPLKDISPEGYYDGLKVDAEIYQTVGELGTTRKIPNKFFGVEIGEPRVEHYYIIPVGEVQNDLSKQKYMLIGASSKEDLAVLKELTVRLPRPVTNASDKACLKFVGIMTEMSYAQRQEVQWVMSDRTDLITVGLGLPNIAYIDNHICPYTLYIRRSSGGSLPAIIAGAALTVAGMGGITLLLIKKHREKSGY